MKRVLAALLMFIIALPAFAPPAFALTFAAAPAIAAQPGDADTPIPPEDRIIDDAYIFTESERQALNTALNAATMDSGAHFIIMTTREDIADDDMEPLAYAYFDSYIRGMGGLDDCVILNINMETRWVEIRCFGELRYMITDYEASVVREALTPDMSEGNYYRAAKTFVQEMSSLIKRRYAENHIDTPAVDPALRLYDFGGFMSEQDRGVISGRLNDLSDKTGADFIIVTLDGNVDEGYLQRYASSFYNQNFKGNGGYTGAYILVISCYGEDMGGYTIVNSTASVAAFGTHDPENQVLWDDQKVVSERLGMYGVFTACASFISRNLDIWQGQNIVLPEFDPADYVTDYRGVLTDAQRDGLSALLQGRSEELGTGLYFIITPYSTQNASFAFSRQLWLDIYPRLPENAIVLTVSGPIMVLGDVPAIDLNYKGSRPADKLGVDARRELYDNSGAVWRYVNIGDYPEAVWVFEDIVSKALTSWVPKAIMAEEFFNIMFDSFVLAIVLGVVVVLVMRFMHGFGSKRKVPARNYYVRNSLSLHFSTDRFISTHTSRMLIESDSGSSGGGGGSSGGGSSGGGHSSGSGGRF